MMKALRPFVIFVVPLVGLTLACSALGGPRINPENAVPGAAEPAALFRDDFSDPSSGWDQAHDSDGTTDYADGVYRIFVDTANLSWWANPGRSFGDVRVEVDATKVAGPDDNGFGIICRSQDSENFYYMMVSSDGYAMISKMSGGNSELLVGDNWLESTAINQGAATNHLRAECVGSNLSLYANDQLIASATDSDFSSGDVGLIARSFEESGVDIAFDDFVVREP